LRKNRHITILFGGEIIFEMFSVPKRYRRTDRRMIYFGITAR